ncbi:AAA family ATPase [Paenibacillus sp. GSMTC-2017]|uniref:AAA family ATPase n=1 Tax=Paenibacillus sp. GSMTC-2017 TaxID=2794350 RepID=UPI0018D67337|nr:AAA family ATPase [Paenibacillus sp. GSMTC-2017]MBH5317004.1 AAA family ATPase [Paenibacillus sp. GSMTC-2017]
MRLVEAHIDGYGRLNNRRVDLDAPVIVVFGPNEAGKSTLFGFVRTMLFGFTKRSNLSERQEPIHGGRHGGRLIFRDSSGASYIINRYADEAGGKPKVRMLEGSFDSSTSTDVIERIMEQANWEGQFLGSMNARLYRQLYAITLTELNEVSALSGAELGRHLYQAGWDGGKAIAAAEKEIMQELDSLFKLKGTNQRMSNQWKMLEQFDAELRRIADGIDRFNVLRDDSESTENAIIEVSVKLPSLQQDLQLLRKAVHSRPHWLRIQELLTNRKKIAYAERLLTGSEQIWDDLQRQYAEMIEHIEELQQEKSLLERQKSVLLYDNDFIDKGAETSAVLQDADRIRSLKQQLPELELEMQGLDVSIGTLVTSISTEWTERQLRELIVTVADRDFARGKLEIWQTFRRSEERIQAEMETLRAEERELLLQLNDSEERLRKVMERLEDSGRGRFALLPDTKPSLTAAWDAFDEALRDWELERAGAIGKVGAKSQSFAGSGLKLAGLCGVGGALAVAGAAASGLLGETSGIATISAITIGGASVALLLGMKFYGNKRENGRSSHVARISSRSNRAGRSRGELRVYEALEVLVKEPDKTYATLFDATSTDQTSNLVVSLRSAIRMEVQERLDAISEFVRMTDIRIENRSRLDRIRGELSERGDLAEVAVRKQQLEAVEWGNWLVARSLPNHMSPAAALEAFEIAESALERLRQYDRLYARQATTNKEINSYQKNAEKLCANFPNSVRELQSDPTLAMQLLQAEIQRHVAIQAQADGIITRIEQLLITLENLQSKEATIKQSLNELIVQAGLTDEVEYATALRDRQLLADLDMELTRLQIELTAGLTNERLEQLQALFAQFDEEQLAEALEEAKVQEANVVELQFELLEKRGRLNQAREQLMQADERQRLILEREMTIAGLENNMERYAVLMISKALIDRTKRIYEEERQPVVLQTASHYFRTLTGGRYIRVSVNVEQSGIRVEKADHSMLDSSLLSRGTAEQLYLAMRLALARESSQEEKLPLMLDDLFVNFDSERLHAAARLVAELANERQLLLFTCHEKVRDVLLAICKETILVHLSPPEAV